MLTDWIFWSTRPKSPYRRQGLPGLWGRDTVRRVHFEVFSASHFTTWTMFRRHLSQSYFQFVPTLSHYWDNFKTSLGQLWNNLRELGPSRPTGGGPRLDRSARIQFGRVHFGVFSTSCFVPPARSSGWIWPALSSVVRHPSYVLRHPSSVTHGGPNWPFRCLDFPTFWFWFFSQTCSGSDDFSLDFPTFWFWFFSQTCSGRDDFLLKVFIFCHSWGVPTDWKFWFFVTYVGF